MIGDEGAAALGPHLGKLVMIQILNLRCTHAYTGLWVCYGSVGVNCVWSACAGLDR